TQHPIDDDNASNFLPEEESFVGVFGPFDFTKLDRKIMSKVATLHTEGDDKGEAGSEIVAFDTASKKMFITNGAKNRIDVATINADKTLTVGTSIDMSTYGSAIQSVDVSNGKVAVAMGSADKVVTKGSVVLMDLDGGNDTNTSVGFLPDMVTFNEDGTKVIVANEGEPRADSGVYVDVAGSVGVLTVSNQNYVDINFTGVTLTDAADTTPVRLGGTPSNDQALDLEPEYITVLGGFAYVTLQENNAIAKIDLSNNSVALVKSLGAKDHSLAHNSLDIEEDGNVKLSTYPGLYGLYQPDTIASYKVGNETYLVTANEGDGRSYPTYDVNSSLEEGDVFEDEKKISKLHKLDNPINLDASIAAAYENENDLKVMTDISTSTKLYAYGARSFSIWDASGDLVYDSGNMIAQVVYQMDRELFNQDEFEKDGRSGNKGAEPEALALGEVDGKTYAFVGLERQGGIVIVDISNPQEPEYVDYINTHKEGDIAPEGMKFISKADSPTGKALLLVAYEVSSTTVVYEINK
ncbi:MAG: choice-of-anchor I family protein, partial [Campylobacterota bacterium]|nr:choice-of-anchor I family protein [Campylobacterota bacterium]